MKTTKIPKTDSIEELARFWDTHEFTEFDAEMEEVAEPVFEREGSIRVDLKPRQAKAVRRLAESKGISQAELVRQWVKEKLDRSSPRGHARR